MDSSSSELGTTFYCIIWLCIEPNHVVASNSINLPGIYIYTFWNGAVVFMGAQMKLDGFTKNDGELVHHCANRDNDFDMAKVHLLLCVGLSHSPHTYTKFQCPWPFFDFFKSFEFGHCMNIIYIPNQVVHISSHFRERVFQFRCIPMQTVFIALIIIFNCLPYRIHIHVYMRCE